MTVRRCSVWIGVMILALYHHAGLSQDAPVVLLAVSGTIDLGLATYTQCGFCFEKAA
jgi:hypothetical protein